MFACSACRPVPPISFLASAGSRPSRLSDPLVLPRMASQSPADGRFGNKQAGLLRAFPAITCTATCRPTLENAGYRRARGQKFLAGGKATKRGVNASPIVRTDLPPSICSCMVPDQRKGPATAFMGLYFCGNDTMVSKRLHRFATGFDAQELSRLFQATLATNSGQRDAERVMWAMEQSTLIWLRPSATFADGDVEPDRPDAQKACRAQYTNSANLRFGAIPRQLGYRVAMDYSRKGRSVDAGTVAVRRPIRTKWKSANRCRRLRCKTLFALAISSPRPAPAAPPRAVKVNWRVPSEAIRRSLPPWLRRRVQEMRRGSSRADCSIRCQKPAVLALCALVPCCRTTPSRILGRVGGGQFETLKSARRSLPLPRGCHGLKADKLPEPEKLVDDRLGLLHPPQQTLRDHESDLEGVPGLHG